MTLMCEVRYFVRLLFHICIVIIVTSSSQARPGAPQWWNIIKLLQVYPNNESLAMTSQDGALGIDSITCTRIPGLVPKQLRYCSRRVELMPSIATGIKMGIDQCKFQFKTRRWNCRTLPLRRKKPNRRRSVFGPVLERASREAAFVHSIAAAGVAHSVTRACAKGALLSCGCDVRRSMRDDSAMEARGWRWGGCNDDVEFGISVSREFADARDQGTDARAIMNRHNNEAGRLVLRDNMQLKCKCHGLSGSCELKTCWRALPPFKVVGEQLKRMYNDASEMTVQRHQEARGWVDSLEPRYGVFDPPESRDLLFFENSPNFCERNKRLGIEGTRSRVCNATSSGADGCDLLCCGRGYKTTKKQRVEKCNCVFHWCCSVTCQECVINYEEHTCE